MKFQWKYEAQEVILLRTFLHQQGISRGLLAKIKFQGGEINVNQQIENVLYRLQTNDEVTVTIPDEQGHDTLIGEDIPLEIAYEDEHYLVVNKPTNVASIPAQYHPAGTMVNRVKGYYQKKQYPNQVVHVVTRLDRDTTGLMLFAKHGYAHALMDIQLRERTMIKKYQALVSGDMDQLNAHDWIELPIKRDPASIIKRMVGEEGLPSATEYHLVQRTQQFSLVEIQLHTGRTHQIRVHFSALGCPLVGDDMYGGRMDLAIQRQSLHCVELHFFHPFKKEMIEIRQELPEDMRRLIELGVV